ncbi:MAG: hypothetical protein ACREPP_11830 [Rhodanobacteraceae bacterium]
MSGSFFLSLRAAHILLAALWLGAAFLLSLFVLPAARDVGPAGGQFMATLQKRKLHAFMAGTAVLTVLSGIWLYWLFTAGLQTEVMFSAGGLAFGIGGLCGVLAMILGGAIMGRGTARMVAMGEEAVLLSDVERTVHMQQMEALRQRLGVASKFILLLMVAALLLMAVGHYL